MTESFHTSRQCLTQGPEGEVVAYLDGNGTLQTQGIWKGQKECPIDGVSAFAVHGCSKGVAIAYIVGGALAVRLKDRASSFGYTYLTRPGEATGQPSVYTWTSSAGLAVAVAWAHGPSKEILVQRWVGGAWLANPEAIHEEGTEILEFPSVTGNGNGNLWVAFRGSAQGRYHVSGAVFDGAAWGSPRSLAPNGMDPSVLCLTDGSILLGWHQGWDVYVGEWRQKGGQAFLADTVKLSKNGHFVGLSESSGTILAAWSEWSEVGDVKRDDLRSVGAAIRQSRGRWTACTPTPWGEYQLQPGGCGSRLAWWDGRAGGAGLVVTSVERTPSVPEAATVSATTIPIAPNAASPTTLTIPAPTKRKRWKIPDGASRLPKIPSKKKTHP